MDIRKKIVAGNWKMNKTVPEAMDWVDILIENMQSPLNVSVAIFPSFTVLHNLANRLAPTQILLGAQNLHESDAGAYTGEISGQMLLDAGARYVLVGHSERRLYAQETNTLLAQKLQQAFKWHLTPIYCIGESEKQRSTGQHFEIIRNQLDEGLQGCTPNQISSLIVAYEPVWAIGTGMTATIEDASSMHKFIRTHIGKMYSESLANQIRILYGGSVKPGNAAGFFNNSDIDGALVGGASLDAKEFAAIVAAAIQ